MVHAIIDDSQIILFAYNPRYTRDDYAKIVDKGIDTDLVNEEFKRELDGYQCDIALAIGYHHPEEDYNAKLPKSRRSLDRVLVRI